jgi:hypothetical protein
MSKFRWQSTLRMHMHKHLSKDVFWVDVLEGVVALTRLVVHEVISVAKRVVLATCLFVGETAIGLGKLLESIMRLFALVLIRMTLE